MMRAPLQTHFNGDYRFHFHKYMVYAYEADFKKVVSIRLVYFLRLVSLGFVLNHVVTVIVAIILSAMHALSISASWFAVGSFGC